MPNFKKASKALNFDLQLIQDVKFRVPSVISFRVGSDQRTIHWHSIHGLDAMDAFHFAWQPTKFGAAAARCVCAMITDGPDALPCSSPAPATAPPA